MNQKNNFIFIFFTQLVVKSFVSVFMYFSDFYTFFSKFASVMYEFCIFLTCKLYLSHTSHFTPQKMFLLNLPEYAHKITKKNGELYIYDKIRKKNLVFTPEEYVRQQLICALCECEYPLALMCAESGLNYNKRQKRTDLIVYDRLGEPFLLLECKAMYIKLSDNTIFQVSQYNFIIKARYVMISNGIEACFYEMDYINNKHIQLAEIPVFE